MEEKVFGELFPIEKDFPKHFTECCNLLYLFKYFASHITIIPRKIHCYTTGQSKSPL